MDDYVTAPIHDPCMMPRTIPEALHIVENGAVKVHRSYLLARVGEAHREQLNRLDLLLDHEISPVQVMFATDNVWFLSPNEDRNGYYLTAASYPEESHRDMMVAGHDAESHWYIALWALIRKEYPGI